jgi:hypothetical protein
MNQLALFLPDTPGPPEFEPLPPLDSLCGLGPCLR